MSDGGPSAHAPRSGARVVALHHVQLAMPPGGEGSARRFYGELLGLPEVPKPPVLALRGGCWFERGELRVHLGIEEDFRPARKAHPALVVSGLAGLVAHLRRCGCDVREAPADELPGVARAFVDDPFGNRVELIEGGGAMAARDQDPGLGR